MGDNNTSRPNKGECRRSKSRDARAQGSGVVAVDEGFGGVPHHREVAPSKSVNRPIEPEQPVSSH